MPNNATITFVVLLIIGSRIIDAKKTCPAFLQISDIDSNFSNE
ncbi:MAG: hypothetical protein NTZ38_01395 [Candidatus Taylorbacteria bacterium]|nr:hypothetical protein [Candidatus Taylorbacteria bacterium]